MRRLSGLRHIAINQLCCKLFYAVKSSWSAKTRMSEVVAIETSKERISVLVKDAEFRKPHANGDGLLGCLPTVVWHEDMQDMIAGPRQFMTGY